MESLIMGVSICSQAVFLVLHSALPANNLVKMMKGIYFHIYCD